MKKIKGYYKIQPSNILGQENKNTIIHKKLYIIHSKINNGNNKVIASMWH